MKTKLVNNLVVVGAGGFGQEVIWAARNLNSVQPAYNILGYCDDDPDKKGKTIYGCQVLGVPEEVDRACDVKPCFVCAIGNNRTRCAVVGRLLALKWIPVTIIDPSVIIAEYVQVGVGNYIGAGSFLSPYARIGNHVIINQHCSIGHNSILEDFVQTSPGSKVSGSAHIKEGAMLASNAVVAPGVMIGKYSVLGACSFAARNIPDRVTAIGNPARVIMKHKG
jgi:sugar O-acyltransferase (sialic acid O-acetyltransferase NeuD family)